MPRSSKYLNYLLRYHPYLFEREFWDRKILQASQQEFWGGSFKIRGQNAFNLVARHFKWDKWTSSGYRVVVDGKPFLVTWELGRVHVFPPRN